MISISLSKATYKLRPTELILAGLVTAYVAFGYLLAWKYDQLGSFSPTLYADTTALTTLMFMIAYTVYRIARIYYIMLFIRPPELLVYLKQDFLAGPLNKERYIRAIPVFLAFIVLFSTFTSLKTMIPTINPFSWDPFWADFDQKLHFGIDPWRILQPLLGFPDATKGINVIYNYWLFIKYFILYWMLFSLKDPFTRMQFFLTCALCWIINGTFLAILWSSVGPCFYEYVTDVDRFSELFSYLNNVDPDNPLWAIETQTMLWQNHINNTLEFGSGISAMPSMHVASAFIFMLLGLRSNWFWKIASVLFFLSILLGSVHLGWHYAVDGYIAVITTFILWWISGKIITKLDPEIVIKHEQQAPLHKN